MKALGRHDIRKTHGLRNQERSYLCMLVPDCRKAMPEIK